MEDIGGGGEVLRLSAWRQRAAERPSDRVINATILFYLQMPNSHNILNRS